MIQIDKSKPFASLYKLKKKLSLNNWEQLEETEDGRKVRSSTREYILRREQNDQCAYTELPLAYENNDSHIEHLKKKDSSFFPELAFEWINLFVSCNFDDFGGKYKDNVYLKRKVRVDNELIINPALEDPADFFNIKHWGELEVKPELKEEERIKAQETINAFNLNNKSLKERRKEIIRQIEIYKNERLDSALIIECLDGSGFKSVIDYALYI